MIIINVLNTINMLMVVECLHVTGQEFKIMSVHGSNEIYINSGWHYQTRMIDVSDFSGET